MPLKLHSKMVPKTIQVEATSKYVILEDDRFLYLIEEGVAENIGLDNKQFIPPSIHHSYSADIIIEKKTRRVTKSRWF